LLPFLASTKDLGSIKSPLGNLKKGRGEENKKACPELCRRIGFNYSKK